MSCTFTHNYWETLSVGNYEWIPDQGVGHVRRAGFHQSCILMYSNVAGDWRLAFSLFLSLFLSFSTPNPDYLSLTRWPEERAEAEKQDGNDERILLTTLMTPYKLNISHEKRIPEYERRRIYDSNQLVLFANAFLPFLHFSENRIQSLRLWEEITCKTCMWSW